MPTALNTKRAAKKQNPPPTERAKEPPKQLSLLHPAPEQSAEEVWKPERDGDGIEGQITRIIRDIGRYRATHFYIQTVNALRIVIANAETVLARKLGDWALEVGDRVGILYLGERVGSDG